MLMEENCPDEQTYAEVEVASEMKFVGGFWGLVGSGDEKKMASAWQAMTEVKPEHIGNVEVRKLYVLLCDKLTQGESVSKMALLPDYAERKIDPDAIEKVLLFCGSGGKLEESFKRVIQGWQRRTMVDMCVAASSALRNGHGQNGGRALAERISMRILNVYSESGEARFLTNDMLVQRAVDRSLETKVVGFNWPWEKMTNGIGPAVPGEVYGMTGFSGCGKSTAAVNIAFGLAKMNQPVILFSTEMGETFLDRAIAAQANVSQFRAEKRKWTGADEERIRFEQTGKVMQDWPWAMVTRANITPGEIFAAVRVLRKRWPGRTVLVIVDHMHRLNYGTGSGDDGVGPATKACHNMAMEDQEGGMVFLLLYQPRKPELGGKIYRPAQAFEIRGHSEVWNELNTHFSPYRQWVETDPTLRQNPWGTMRTKMKAGSPVIGKPGAENVKLDDEHMYFNPDKLRTGGEGTSFWMKFNRVSGLIWEPEQSVAALE